MISTIAIKNFSFWKSESQLCPLILTCLCRWSYHSKWTFHYILGGVDGSVFPTVIVYEALLIPDIGAINFFSLGETKRKFESVYTGGTMHTPDSGKVYQYWHCCGSEDPFDPGCTAAPHSSYDDWICNGLDAKSWDILWLLLSCICIYFDMFLLPILSKSKAFSYINRNKNHSLFMWFLLLLFVITLQKALSQFCLVVKLSIGSWDHTFDMKKWALSNGKIPYHSHIYSFSSFEWIQALAWEHSVLSNRQHHAFMCGFRFSLVS